MTHDTWHVTYDTWQVGGGEPSLKKSAPSSYSFGVNMFWRYFHKEWISKSISNIGDCRTAPARPGLLNIAVWYYGLIIWTRFYSLVPRTILRLPALFLQKLQAWDVSARISKSQGSSGTNWKQERVDQRRSSPSSSHDVIRSQFRPVSSCGGLTGKPTLCNRAGLKRRVFSEEEIIGIPRTLIET